MAGIFTGALAIVLGLGFWLGLLAMMIGTVLGVLLVAYLSTWGPRTGAGQLPNARMAFGGGVVLPAVLQWLSSIAWTAGPGEHRCHVEHRFGPPVDGVPDENRHARFRPSSAVSPTCSCLPRWECLRA